MEEYREYRPADREPVLEFLREPAGIHLYLRNRFDLPGDGRARMFLRDDRLLGVTWVGRGQNLVFAGDDARFLAAQAAHAAAHESTWLLAVGLLDPTTRFLDLYRGLSKRRPRLDRVQGFYRQVASSLPDLGEPRLRAATPEDLFEATTAAVQMSAEDFDLDPVRIDREGVRRAMERKILEGRSFVLYEGNRLVFKADLAVRAAEGGQVEGVFTTPDRRGLGIASRCLAELGRRLLPSMPLLCLHVSDRNLPAKRAYEKAGYRREADLRLAIMG